MEKLSSSTNLDKVSSKINSNFEEHQKKTKECCVKSSVIPLSDYYQALQKEYQQIESRFTPTKTKPDPLEYINLFKAFEEYPVNLQKPKKQSSKDHSRLNATMKPSKNNSSSTSINSSKVFDDQPSAAVIYNDFCKYAQKLSDFKEEFRKQATSKEYAEGLQSINTFARELDKILLSEVDSAYAFNEEEDAKIKRISDYMEHFVYIQENQDLFGSIETKGANSSRLDDLVDIITDALVAVNCYKPIQNHCA